ncbi:MAG: glycosyltransferase family 39 protein [Actinomycetota bacterium]
MSDTEFELAGRIGGSGDDAQPPASVAGVESGTPDLKRRTTVDQPKTTGFSSQWEAVLVGVLAFLVSSIGASRPYFWSDEAATISAATRPIPDLWRMLGNVDGHQGIYYLLMHCWYALFPVNELSSRLSSALAVGIAAAGVVILGRQISTRTVALTAGIVFAVLPRVTFAGIEARPYAMTMAVAVWLTVLCVQTSQRPRQRSWAVYGGLLLIAILFNLFLVLLVPAHAVAVWMLSSEQRETMRQWGVVIAASIGVAVPFLAIFNRKQQDHSTWVPPLSPETLRQILREQYFTAGEIYRGVPPTVAAIVAGAILTAAVAIAVKSGSRRPSPLVAISLTWIAFPTVALLVFSVLFYPLYYPRFLAFTAPAFALLLAISIVRVGRSRTGIAALLVIFAMTTTPIYLAQREPFAKGKMDYRQLAEIVDRYAEHGDCLVVDDNNDPGRRWWPLRTLVNLRHDSYAKLRDFGLASTATQQNGLFDKTDPISSWTGKLSECQTLWTISSRDDTLPGHQRGAKLEPGPKFGETASYQVPSKLGFHIVERWQFNLTQITKSTR